MARRTGDAAGGGRGFTLVELLVVVAIIALLIGVLLPALGRARRSAQTVECLSNMRNLVLAQMLYAHDHNGQLVNYGLSHGGSTLEDNVSWLRDLKPYAEGPLTVRSPSDASPHWATEGGGGVPIPGGGPVRYRVTSYGLNEHVTPQVPFDPQDPRQRAHDNLYRMRAPASTIQWVMMAQEGEFAGADHVHVTNWWIGDFAPNAPAQLAARQMQTDAHGGPAETFEARANYAFLDGRAATLMLREVYENPRSNKFDPRFAR